MTLIMGILNATPDSFSDGGLYEGTEAAVERALEIEREGADILDIGGESTRPGAEAVSAEEEKRRVVPLIAALKGRLSIPISIDTRKREVAEAALEAGASRINDVEGFRDPGMRELAAVSGVSLFCMHMQGVPETMQQEPSYPEGVVAHLCQWMERRAEELLRAGVKGERIVFDPGIGFGKTVADNLKILQNLDKLRSVGFPLLIGASRKSFMSKMLQKPPLELLPATLAVNAAAAFAGVDYIRVHDVAAHRDMAEVIGRIKDCSVRSV